MTMQTTTLKGKAAAGAVALLGMLGTARLSIADSEFKLRAGVHGWASGRGPVPIRNFTVVLHKCHAALTK